MSCFMGLVSFLASRPEVLRIAPRHRTRLLNAAARANVQTATVTSTPLTDAGLDGTGEVIQVGGIYEQMHGWLLPFRNKLHHILLPQLAPWKSGSWRTDSRGGVSFCFFFKGDFRRACRDRMHRLILLSALKVSNVVVLYLVLHCERAHITRHTPIALR